MCGSAIRILRMWLVLLAWGSFLPCSAQIPQNVRIAPHRFDFPQSNCFIDSTDKFPIIEPTRLDKIKRWLNEDTIVKKVDSFVKKKNIFAKLVKLAWVVQPVVPLPAPPPPVQAGKTVSEECPPMENRYIRHIEIRVLEPFGPNINQPNRKPQNWLERTGIKAHYRTRNWVIRNQLLFREGEKLQNVKLSESERLLRQCAYLTDARVYTQSYDIDSCMDSVDVLVLVQDVFSANASGGADFNTKAGNLVAKEDNILGLGTRLYNKLDYDPHWINPWRYEGSARANQIGTSYFNGQINYRTEDFKDYYGLNIDKPFLSSIFTWAGGLSIQWSRFFYNETLSDNSIVRGRAVLNTVDYWGGYAFNANDRQNGGRKKTQTIISFRSINNTFTSRPTQEEIRSHYQNSAVILAGLAFSFRDYYKDNYIFGFGKTEDIPLGNLLSFTGGVDRGEITTRYYMSSKMAFGRYSKGLGYYFASAEAGGFQKEGKWEQGVLALNGLYFTEMEGIGKWKVRQYLWERYAVGLNRFPGEELNLDDRNGIRGLSFLERGTKKWVTNYEVNVFAPKPLAGCQIAFIAFTDLGLLAPQGTSIFRSRVLQGYGIGLRIKNEHLVFATAQFSFAYYPYSSPFGNEMYKYYYTANPYYRMQDFGYGQPNVLGFGY